MREAFTWCFPWTLDEEGPEEALSQLAGEIGVDSVSVIAAWGRAVFFRPRPCRGPRIVRMEPGVHFQPDPRRYSGLHVHPTAASWMRNRNPFEQIASAVDRHGLGLRVRVRCCDGGGLAARHASSACVNALGVASAERLCPGDAHVREYVGCLMEDLTANYPVKRLEIDGIDYAVDADVLAAGDFPFPRDSVAAALLAWCFCASCRQRAADKGLDPQRCADRVRARIDAASALAPDEFPSVAALLESDPELAAYHAMRRATVSSLAALIRARVKVDLVFHLSHPPWLSGLEPAQLVEIGSSMSIPVDDLSMPTTRRALTCAVDAAGGAERVEIGLSCRPPIPSEGASLVRNARALAMAGHSRMGFDFYEHLPTPCLDWVRQAIRYSRREGG